MFSLIRLYILKILLVNLNYIGIVTNCIVISLINNIQIIAKNLNIIAKNLILKNLIN